MRLALASRALGWPCQSLSAALIGKGPSLDRMTPERWAKLPALRIAINQAMMVAPGVRWGWAMDEQVARDIARAGGLAAAPGVTGIICPVTMAEQHPQLRPALTFEWREEPFSRLTFRVSPAAALELLHAWGVRTVEAVGFDSWGAPATTAPPAEWRGTVWSRQVLRFCEKDRPNADYGYVNEEIARVLDRTGLAVRWHHLESAPAGR